MKGIDLLTEIGNLNYDGEIGNRIRLRGIVYCFHCGEKFPKTKEGFENCPFCGKGYNDLSQEAQFAVSMMFRTFAE